MKKTGWTAYLAPPERKEDLLHELREKGVEIHQTLGDLFLGAGTAVDSIWAQNIWYDVLEIPFQSISQGAGILKDMQRNWAFYSSGWHRRGSLIQEKLPHIPKKKWVFPQPVPTAPMGGWTLLDENTLLASPRTRSPFPHGEIFFQEDKDQPPSRAYLKLWEALTLLGKYPKPGEVCLDMGASPGGWTWVLNELGTSVKSFDRAALHPRLMESERITHVIADAFKVEPQPADWFFSDIIAYPDRVVEWLSRWVQSGQVKNFVCTIKFKGQTDHAAVARLLEIPGSRLIHLFHNKHELTWFR